MMIWGKIADAAIALGLLLALVSGSDTKIILGICLALQVVTALGDALSFMLRQALDSQIRERAKRKQTAPPTWCTSCGAVPLQDHLPGCPRRSREGE